MDAPLFGVLTQLGDDSLILGQRLCEWCGHAPTIEVDLSLSNLALDLIGQATLLLDYAGVVEGAGRDADRLAFHRSAEAFRNCLLAEQPNGDFAQTIVRHFFYATYAAALFEELVHSSDRRLSEIAAKAAKELRYHAEYAADWVVRLGDGTEESNARMRDALAWHWRFVDDLFLDDADWVACAERGLVPLRQALRPAFGDIVATVLGRAGLDVPGKVWPIMGGRSGRHSEHLSTLLAIMQVLPRAHPQAAW
ncbi:phenylacetate-CoA oxygenase PaaI subunit [Caenibius tardaugens NBRC 16725]|uniref:Phenylacetate-CoA oxygenase PaaI subunit n=1 Tax=Caenibius tardaugens NBRC 16725 TaxID=1219035 RepID=U2YAS2_9SPHN|nr:1,2-phenylacetyl-CoA epoxidase subunit PaaC [Caenibius tardaugens]AZI35385.1 phenylacetate-CoA oxygenase subunit PaaI [Caenibius tardaugens NBRC 16725]GAD50531.1 phenylacetate-CoA oxygenase PaaI subunit [Caenibius tardaugens NBRC 16725]